MDTTALLAAIKRRAYLADAGPQFDDTALLALADEALDELVVPMLVQGGAISIFQQTYTTPLVGGQSRYQVPVGIGSTLLDVHYVDTNSNIFRIALTDEGDRSFHSQLASPIGPQTVYYFDGDSITLMPPPSVGAVGSLVITWPLQPSQLVITSQAAVIIAETSPAVFKLTLPLPSWLSGTPLVDVVAGTSPHMTRVLAARVISIVADVVTVQFQTTLANQGFGVNGGDVMMPTGQSIYPQVPKEAHPLLALEAARRAAMSMKDMQLETAIAADVASKITRVTALLVGGGGRARKQSISMKNRFSALRSARMRAPVRW